MENNDNNGSSSTSKLPNDDSAPNTESSGTNLKTTKMDYAGPGTSTSSSAGVCVDADTASGSNVGNDTASMSVEEKHTTDEGKDRIPSAASSSVRKRPSRFMKRSYRPRNSNANISSSSSSSSEDEDEAERTQPISPTLEENMADSNHDSDNQNRVPTVEAAELAANSSDNSDSVSLGSHSEDEYMNVESDSDTSTVSEETEARINALMDRPTPKMNSCLTNNLINRHYAMNTINRRAINDPLSINFRNQMYGSLYAVERLELLHKMEAHEGCVNSLNFNRSGNLLVTGSDDLNLIVWKWASKQIVLKFETGHRQNIFQTKFIENGTNVGGMNIVTSSRDGEVRLIRVRPSGGETTSKVLYSHRKPVNKVAISDMNPSELLTAGEDGSVMRFDLRDKKLEVLLSLRLENRKVPLYSIAHHPLDPEFCICGVDKHVRVYDKRNMKETVKLLYPGTLSSKLSDIHITSAVYNHLGTEILASYAVDKIYLFDNVKSTLGSYLHSYAGHRNVSTIKGVNFFGPSCEYVMSGSDCGNIFMWDRNTEGIVQWLAGDDDGVVNCLEGHPSFPVMATSGLDRDVKIWSPTKANGQISIDDLKKCVQKNLSSSRGGDCISDLNSSLLEYLMRALSRRRRLAPTRNPNGDASSTPEENSSDSSFDDDLDDYENAAYISNRSFGSQSCTTS